MPRLCVTAIKEYNNEWIEAIEVSSMLDVAEMVINSALLRKESRGTHFRKDYPRLDNENWLNHITIELKNGKMKLETDSVVMNILKPTNRNNEANSHS
jgi:succinate dehydrogenase/fumarate reductase flavoprotein subunit